MWKGTAIGWSMALAFAALLSASSAGAQGDATAAADALFERAREALDAGDYDKACKLFRESNEVDPAIGTELNLARCEQLRGNLATAWALFRSLVRQMPSDDDRLPEAKKRVSELDVLVPRLEIVLADDAPEGTTVERGDVVISRAFGEALPLDPGSHELVVKAKGHRSRTFTVVLEPGDRKRLEVAPGPELPLDEPAAEKPSPEPARAQVSDAGRDDPLALGWIVGGVGAAGVVVGGVAGLLTLQQKREFDANCDTNLEVCNSDGGDARDAGRRYGTISTIGFAVGAVGLAAGAYLLFIAPDDDGAPRTAIAPALGPRSGGVLVQSRF